MKQVKITIIAQVTTTVILNEGETIEQLKNRDVDIYLHDGGEFGFREKMDLGADSSTIIVHDISQKSNREKALLWWASFPNPDKHEEFLDFKTNHYTPANNYTELTGREIEAIYNSIPKFGHMEWWNKLNGNEQNLFYNTYKLHKHTPANNPNELVDMDIEYIFDNILEK